MSPTKHHHKRLVLLDAHAIIHRAYHALPDFATTSGEPTGALYGIVTMLIKLVTDLKPDYIAACFDLPGPTHRHFRIIGRNPTNNAGMEGGKRKNARNPINGNNVAKRTKCFHGKPASKKKCRAHAT
jgi:5'-3' exonuclease